MKPFDGSGRFQQVVEKSDVRRLAFRGAGATILSSSVGLSIQIIATVILARLLAPEDFGLVAMVTTFSLLLTNCGFNGITEAVLQRQEIDHILASNLFWINLGVGFLLTVAFAAAGSPIARLYGNPEVATATKALSVTIIATSSSVLHLALLQRAMFFHATSAIDIVARIVSVGVSILFGLRGWGYWALVAGAVAQPLVVSIGAWTVCQWLPGFPRRATGTDSTVLFAINTYGRFSLNYFARNVDNLLVGWRFGKASLGFYKKAYDLFALSAGQLTSPLTNVAVSALSRLSPPSIQYNKLLFSAMALMAFVGMALSGDLTLVGEDLIRVLLGPGWEEAGHIFTFFGPGIGAMILYYIHGWIHLSIGRADRWFRWGLVEICVTCLLFLLALPWGPLGIAGAWTISFWILTIPSFWYAGRPIQLKLAQVLGAIWKFVAASLLAGCACMWILQRIPLLIKGPSAVDALARIVVTSLLFGALYLVAVITLHQGHTPLYQAAELLTEAISLSKSSKRYPEAATVLACGTEDSVAPTSKVVDSGPLVSILIPAFNAQEWIGDTLRSAIAQAWEPKEIILVDDGSTDQTLAVAREFESDRVRVVTQENLGAAAARNKALALSRGDYIQWLDADDLLAPDKIARQMKALEQCQSKRTLLSSPWGRFFYRYSRAQFVPTALWHDLSPIEWLLCKMANNLYMQTATWLVSRELTDAAGPWDARLLVDDDGEYFCRVLLASDGVRFVPEARVYYRAPLFNTLNYIGQSNAKIEAQWLSVQLHIGYLRSLEDSERVRAACVRFLRAWLMCFHPERPDIVNQAQYMARDLGGELGVPCLSWKYSWIRPLLGWRLAKRFHLLLPKIRWTVKRHWDKVFYRIEKAVIGSIRNTGISL